MTMSIFEKKTTLFYYLIGLLSISYINTFVLSVKVVSIIRMSKSYKQKVLQCIRNSKKTYLCNNYVYTSLHMFLS